MAKGMEDTAFYIYNRPVSLNEVGGNPAQFGTARELLHQFNTDRQAHLAARPVTAGDTRHEAGRRRPRAAQRPE